MPWEVGSYKRERADKGCENVSNKERITERSKNSALLADEGSEQPFSQARMDVFLTREKLALTVHPEYDFFDDDI